MDSRPIRLQTSTAPRTWAVVSAITLAAVLRFYGITQQSYWIDELISALSIRVSVESLFSELYGFGTNLLPPFFDYTLKLWTELFGQSQLAVRSLSAVLGVLLVYLSYAIANEVVDPQTALLAALLAAVSPYGIFYSQEARCYMLLAVLLGAASLALARYVKNGGRRYGLLWLIADVLAFYTHIYAAFGFAAQALYVLVSLPGCANPRKVVLRAAIGFAVVGVLCIPWALFMLSVLMTHFGRAEIIGKDSVLGFIGYAFFSITYGYSLGPSIEELHQLRNLKEVLAQHGLVTIGASGIAGLLMVGGWIRLWAHPAARAFLGLHLAVPLGLALGMMAIIPSGFRPRYIVMTLPFMAAVFALGIRHLWKYAVGKVVVVVYCAMIGLSLVNYYTNPHYWREDYRGAAATVAADPALPVFAGIHQTWAFEKLLPGMRIDALTAAALDALPANRPVWVILNRPWAFDSGGGIRSALASDFRLIAEQRLPGFRVLQVKKDD